jgi:ribosomal-protein-alanine N-acetyltransferase
VDLTVAGPLLTLRYATLADAPALFELGRDPEVTRFFSWGPYEREEEAAAYIETLAPRRESGQQLDFLIVHRDHGPIGVTGLSELSVRDRRAMIGTWLTRARWGSGANFESKALIAALAFERLRMDRLSAYADTENPRSQAALERIGFSREGVLHGWHRHGDRVRDVAMYAFLREAWEESRLREVPVDIRGDPPGGWVVA